jgi:hypothetical protein
MAKAKRQSNNRQTEPPSGLPPGDHPLDGPLTKLPLGWRPHPKYPGYYEVDDLPKPALTQYWSEENLGEFGMLIARMRHHVAMEAKEGRCLNHDDLVPLFEALRLSNGKKISNNQAKKLATFCRSVKDMDGGNKKRIKRSNP